MTFLHFTKFFRVNTKLFTIKNLNLCLKSVLTKYTILFSDYLLRYGSLDEEKRLMMLFNLHYQPHFTIK